MMKNKKNMKAENYNSNLFNDLLAQITPEEQKTIDRKMLLAAKIADAMKAKGWNQTKFAEEMGKYNSEISKWLSGTHTFNCETLWTIGDKLCVDLLPVRELPKLVQIKYVPIVIKTTPTDANIESFSEIISGTIIQKEKGIFTTQRFSAKIRSDLKGLNSLHGDC